MLLEKFYSMIMINVECPCFDKGNLAKHKTKKVILVLLEQLLDTAEYQFDKL